MTLEIFFLALFVVFLGIAFVVCAIGSIFIIMPDDISTAILEKFHKKNQNTAEEYSSCEFKAVSQEVFIPTKDIKDKRLLHTIKEINSLLTDIYKVDTPITSSTKKIIEIYVPELIDLVTKYVELESQTVQTTVCQATLTEIESLINDFKDAIKKQLQNQTDESTLPVLSEIEAIRTKMTMDGFM